MKKTQNCMTFTVATRRVRREDCTIVARQLRVRRFVLQRAPEAMARAAGTAFRLFAGTDSLNVGLTASHTATLDPNDPQVYTTFRTTT